MTKVGLEQERKRLWKAVERYVAYIKKEIPFGLLISHSYSIDDRKEWKKLKKAFKVK
ncbi:MAG: hypothetical protein AABY22_29755 [Nanoarchaeota archaeon]